ncbi:MAG: SMC family ATPase [Candidatus Korarchaeum sp.]
MRIRRVYLENFGSHQRTELTFSDGINAIIGNNGAGKTTLLEAISYALYHRTDRPAEELIRIGASRMRVELEFEVSGRSYLVIRERSRDGAVSAELYEITRGSKRLLQRDQTKVSSQIEAILGFSRDVFLQGIYVRQGEIQALLESQPAKRKEIIARLLGIDILERIWEELKDVIERLSTEIASLDREISTMGDVDKERARVLEEIDSIEESLLGLEREISSLEGSIANLHQRVDELEIKRGEFIELKSQLDEVNMRISSNLRRKEKLEKDIRRLDEELSKLPYLESLALKYEEVSKLRDLLRRASELRKELELLRESLNELNSIEGEIVKVESRREEFEEVKRKIEEKRRIKDEYIKIDARLRSLKERESSELRRLSEVERRFNERVKPLEDLFGELPRELQGILEVYSKKMEELNESVNRDDSGIKALESERERISSRMGQYSAYLEELISGPERCPLCGSRLTDEKIEELKRNLSESVELMRARLSEIDENLRKLREDRESKLFLIDRIREVSPKTLSDVFREWEESKRSLNEIRDLLSETYREATELESKIRDLPELEEKYHSLNAEFNKIELLKERANRIRRLIAGADADKLEQELEGLEGEVGEIAAKLGIKLEEVEAEYSKSKEALAEYGRLRGMIGERERLLNMLREISEEISSDREKAAHLEERMSKLGFDESSLERAKAELRLLEEKLKESLRSKGELEGTLRELHKKKEELALKSEKLRILRKRKEKLEIFRSRIQKVRDLFSKDKGIQSALRERAKPLVGRELNEIFGTFGFDYDSIELDDNFTPMLRRGGRDYPFDMLSGGERISLALALRLAIARYLISTRIESFILDEPTVHLDDERIESLLEALSSLQIPQLIVVTHSTRFRDIASRSILVSKAGGISNVEVLDEVIVSG